MNIGIVGSGVVGRAVGIGFSTLGNKVLFNDIHQEVLKKLVSLGYLVTESKKELLKESELVFVCVKTPTKDGKQDLTNLSVAMAEIGTGLKGIIGYRDIVVKSTVLPMTTRSKSLPLLQKFSGKKAGRDFGLCVNPEFIRHYNAVEDFLNPWRVVIGEFDQRSGSLLEEAYRPFNTKIIRTNLETAELIKYVSNSFLATKISFFNEMHLVARKLGIDPDLVSDAVALDRRIGTYGIKGGRPFGGPCLPKDLEAFKEFCVSLGLNPLMLSSTFEVNKELEKARHEKSSNDFIPLQHTR